MKTFNIVKLSELHFGNIGEFFLDSIGSFPVLFKIIGKVTAEFPPIDLCRFKDLKVVYYFCKKLPSQMLDRVLTL